MQTASTRERRIVRSLEILLVISVLGMSISAFLAYEQNGPAPQAWGRAFQSQFSGMSQSLGIAWFATQTFTPSPTLPPTLTQTPTRTPTRTPKPTQTSTPTPTPTHTFTPEPTQTPAPPESAAVEDLAGHTQRYSLNCEAQAAADLAAYFGIQIDPLEFQKQLPVSDDPDEGFVGAYNGAAGLPPNNYGVHAAPVASLLRTYRLNAYSEKHLSFDQLKYEIAAGKPVMVWVVNSVVNGQPVSYTAKNGNTTTVVYLEHTVLLVGYDAQQVTIVDGGMKYHRSIDQFLSSWGVLENMAVRIGNPQMIE
jgi:uncharacterized protein YvpB